MINKQASIYNKYRADGAHNKRMFIEKGQDAYTWEGEGDLYNQSLFIFKVLEKRREQRIQLESAVGDLQDRKKVVCKTCNPYKYDGGSRFYR